MALIMVREQVVCYLVASQSYEKNSKNKNMVCQVQVGPVTPLWHSLRGFAT